MAKIDPYAPPQKVTDPDAVSKLDQLLVAFGQMARMFDGLGEELRATVEAVAQREAPTVDLSPLRGDLAALVERIERQPKPDLKFPPELEQMLRQQAVGGITKDDWNDLTQRLQEAVRSSQNAPTVISGRAGGDMRLKDANQNVVSPATEETVSTLATQATLASVLTDLQGKRDGTGSEPLYTSSSVAAKTGEAKFFIADSGRLETTVTNNWINLTFTNPTGSGKTAYIVAITVESDQTSVWAKFYRGPTLNTPTTARTAYNGINLLSTGAYAATCQVKGDALATEMDNATTLVTRVTSNVSLKLELMPLIVTAGTTVGFGANLGGAGVGSVAVYWFEE